MKILKAFKIKADPRVKNDLKQAKEFLKSRRADFDKQFLIDYRSNLKSLQKNPFSILDTIILAICLLMFSNI